MSPGLRRGEIIALDLTDCRLQARPAHYRPIRLVRPDRYDQGPRILYQRNAEPVSENTLRSWMERGERAGGLAVTGHIHQLRHTFCSHLAMRGAPAKAIQELAGHADLSTTMRYMHLSPGSLNQAIRLLEQRDPVGGNSGATKAEEKRN